MAEQEENLIDETAEMAAETEVTEKVIPEIDPKYRMIILAAQRAKQLQRGANARCRPRPAQAQEHFASRSRNLTRRKFTSTFLSSKP
ncbi:MAG: DNA-directed RNA polymerase subunit omega [Acidobacteria bacterium]|nr:DNA-directed RNA polymerase subunit omega [Acidobacteriota bacterium]